jgi:hypothetical protein
VSEISDFATLQPMARTFEATVPVNTLWTQAFKMIEQAHDRAAIIRHLTGYEVNEFREERIGGLVNDAACAALTRAMQDDVITLYVSDGDKCFRILSGSAVDVRWATGVLEADAGNLHHWIGAARLPLMTTEADEARAISCVADELGWHDPDRHVGKRGSEAASLVASMGNDPRAGLLIAALRSLGKRPRKQYSVAALLHAGDHRAEKPTTGANRQWVIRRWEKIRELWDILDAK